MENEIIINNTPPEDNAAKTVAYGIYILYLAAIVLPILPIIGIIFAYIFENDAKSLLKSHYQFLIRSFWISILYFGIASLLVIFVIGFVLLPLCFIWWIIRMARGIKSLLRHEPIADPKSLLF